MLSRASFVFAVTVALTSASAACSSTTKPKTDPAPAVSDSSSASPRSSTEPATEASASPTADAGAGAKADDNVITLFIHQALVDCEGGSGPMKCMQVRKSEDAEWEWFYDSIEGFTYEESNAYELQVEVTKDANPPADGSSLKYKLVKVVSTRKVDKSGKP